MGIWSKVRIVLRRHAWSIALIAVFLSLLYHFRAYAQVDCGQVQSWIQSWGPWASLYFFGLYVLATLGFFPGILLSLVAGLAFGLIWGTFLVTSGATVGSVIIFLIARYFFKGQVEKRLAKKIWFQTFRQRAIDDGFFYILFVRLVPLFPFGGINLASGLLPLRLRDYFFGSFFGMIPGSFAYVYLGRAGCQVIQPFLHGEYSLGSISPEDRYSFAGALLLLIALSALPLLVRRRQKRPL